ncbi:hypothetical protein PoB_007583900 [Plakobranchus ocellatus]|uniref:Uncharacterized protein n=1 Tax=Plakobranchus ocellatus TaxID=259542 RepID=A0AAV4DZ39_9GAST|nr:hypothetical protein PoB_007583900 [Plakobranchus ocellatus]
MGVTIPYATHASGAHMTCQGPWHTRHSEIVCHRFPRNIHFRRVLRDLATHLVPGGHRAALKKLTGIRISDLSLGNQLFYQLAPTSVDKILEDVKAMCWEWIKVHNNVIAGFQALHLARALVAELEPRQKGPCKSQGRIAIHCAPTPLPCVDGESKCAISGDLNRD